MVSKEQYLSVDIVKFIMAILVVGIHCNGIGYGQYPHWLDFINKLAVPFFFVTTGFLIQRKISNTFLSTPPSHCEYQFVVNQVLTKGLRKSARLYLIWTAIYLPLTIIGFWYNNKPFYHDVALFFRQFLFVGENSYSWPLWYLLALVVGLFILRCFFYRGFSVRIIFGIGVLLMFLGYGYTCWRDDVHSGLLFYVFKAYHIVFGSIRNGIFYGFPLLATGMLIEHAGWTKKTHYLSNVVLIVIGAVLFYFDVTPIFLCVSIIGLFSLVFKVDVKISSQLGLYFRHMSMWIYFLHMYIVFAMVQLHHLGVIQFSIYENWIFVACIMLLLSSAICFFARTRYGAWLTRIV